MSYTYDYNGNLTSETNSSGTMSYTWDYENRLASATLPNNGGTTTFRYDPLGRRIEKVSPTTTSISLYDGNNLIETVNASGTEVAHYSQGQYIDEPLAMQRGTITDYYEADGLGSITSLTGANGGVAQSYTYDSFGNTINSSGSLTNFFRYTSREFDTETNLYYYRTRYYNPAIGRFVTEDPFRFRANKGTFYGYVANDAVNAVDVLGTWQITISGGAGLWGRITLGNNGGGFLNGQWNFGIYFGLGEGLTLDIDVFNRGCHSPGLNWGLEGNGGVGIGPGIDGEAHYGPDPWWKIGFGLPGTPFGSSIGTDGVTVPTITLGESASVGAGGTIHFN